MTRLTLSSLELRRLTGCDSRAKQIAFLGRERIPYRINMQDEIQVSRTAADDWLRGDVQPVRVRPALSMVRT